MPFKCLTTRVYSYVKVKVISTPRKNAVTSHNTRITQLFDLHRTLHPPDLAVRESQVTNPDYLQHCETHICAS